jgi:CHAT domain-containing protein
MGPEHVVWLDALDDEATITLMLGTPDDPGWFPAQAPSAQPSALARALERMGERLWPLLVGPVHARLQELGVKQGAPVIFMPQRGLGLLPIQATFRVEGTERRYLLQDYSISYAYNARMLQTSRDRVRGLQDAPPSLLSVIDPRGDLPHAREEGLAVAALFPAGNTRQLSGPEATTEAVLQSAVEYTHLHFACHGAYNWHEARHSGLFLAGDVLTVAELLGKLNTSRARLAVLSACKTGFVDVIQMLDEYIGLPASFLAAGVPAVVSTLWEVQDLSAMLLIERFYQRYLREGLHPRDALREAQLWLRGVTCGELADRFEMERKKPEAERTLPYETVSPAHWGLIECSHCQGTQHE